MFAQMMAAASGGGNVKVGTVNYSGNNVVDVRDVGFKPKQLIVYTNNTNSAQWVVNIYDEDLSTTQSNNARATSGFSWTNINSSGICCLAAIYDDGFAVKGYTNYTFELNYIAIG